MPNKTLWCIVGGRERPFEISISPNKSIDALTEIISQKIKDRPHPHDLVLWKPKKTIPLEEPDNEGPDNDDDLARRISNLGNFSQFAEKLKLNRKVGHYFENEDEDSLSVIIQLSTSDSQQGVNRDSDRRRTDSSSLEQDLRPFWNRLWNQNEDLIRTIPVVRDSDPVEDVTVEPTIKMLYELPSVFSRVPVFLRKQYEDAYQVLESSCSGPGGGVIITGHPGIGKTMFLYHLLVLRLRNKQPTFFQYSPDFVILFDNRGVRVVSPVFGDLDADEAWALIDSNIKVKEVPWIFARTDCPNFVVVAAPPRSMRWKSLLHNRSNTKLWIMEPFTLEELLQARVLQTKPPREQDILAFFATYGPSARDCFHSCSDLESYDRTIRIRVTEMSWDTLTAALSREILSVSIEDGSHKVVLVAPQPEDHFSARITVVTQYVTQLLWDKDAVARRQNLRKIYSTLSPAPIAKGFTGVLFERAFHQLCMKGEKAFTLRAMSKSTTGHVNYIFRTSKSTSLSVLQLHPRELFSFNNRNRIPGLDAKKYYQPTIPNYPSFASFIYDEQDDQGTNSRRLIAFQMTEGASHEIKSSGLRTLGELGVEDIRFVIVTSVGCEVTCSVERTTYDELRLEMYFLEVDEGELFDE